MRPFPYVSPLTTALLLACQGPSDDGTQQPISPEPTDAPADTSPPAGGEDPLLQTDGLAFLPRPEFPGPDHLDGVTGASAIGGLYRAVLQPDGTQIWAGYGDLCGSPPVLATAPWAPRDDLITTAHTGIHSGVPWVRDTAGGGGGWGGDAPTPQTPVDFVTITCDGSLPIAELPETDLSTWLGEVQTIEEALFVGWPFLDVGVPHSDVLTSGVYWEPVDGGFELVVRAHDEARGWKKVRVRVGPDQKVSLIREGDWER